MTNEERIKIFKRSLARRGLYTSSWVLDRLPYGAMRTFSNILLNIGFRFTIKQKRLAQESLHIAFGQEKSPKEIDEIIRRCFDNLGRGMIELLYFMSRPKLVAQKVSFEGRHHLDAAIKKGNGVIAVTAHFGNFPLMMLVCAREGYKTNAIIRPTRDQDLEKFLLQKRTVAGLKTIYAIPRKQCVAQSLKVLRNKELLFIPLDQNFGSDGGVFVDFFGQQAATATGPIVMARRTQSVILPMFIIRDKDDHHTIIIEPPFEIEEKSSEDETIQFNIAKITKLIENYIRRHPHEWGWMHRRWKSRPAGDTQTQIVHA